MKTVVIFHLINLLLLTAPVIAREPEVPILEPDARVATLEAVVVTGTYPAPGLWQVSRNDKTLWIMGTLKPVLTHITWASPSIETRITQSDIILGPPGISVGTNVGFISGAFMLPAYLRLRKNPDDQRLIDVLPPEIFAHWQRLKQQYLGQDGDVERLRPVYAAEKLFDAAVKKAGMSPDGSVDPVIKRIAKQSAIPVITTSLQLTIADPKATLKQLNQNNLDDVECLQKTMDRLETDLQMMIVRANAWAKGDVEQLKQLPFVDQKQACVSALAINAIAREQGITDLSGQIQTHWIAVATKALTEHNTVFATMPIAQLLEPDGVLATFQKNGFQVKAPE